MRFEYNFALEEYEKIKLYIENNGYRCEVTGSLRRKKEDIGDIDIVVTERDHERLNLEGIEKAVLELISKYVEIKSRINKYEFLLKSGISIHMIPEIVDEFNYTLWQSTGPKHHVKHIKKMYTNKNKIINKKNIDSINKYEEKIYLDIGAQYIEPKNRYKE